MKKQINVLKLGDVATFRNGVNYTKESRGSGCTIIGIPDFQDRFTPDYDSLGQIDPSGIAAKDDFLQKHDIIFVRSNGNKALVGRSLYLDRDIQALFSGFCIRARIFSDELDPRFFAYFTRSDHFKKSISASAGTNINNLNQDILSNVAIPRIEKDQQIAIAEVLGYLDAKIQLNHRINAELDGMAKLLYDYWFVQFDFPMTAAQATALGKPKLAGQPYRASGGKMVNNETLKREIPEGWAATTLSKFANITMGQSPPGESYNQERIGMVFFQGATDFGWRYPKVREFTTSPSRLAKQGDILLSVRAPVGTLNIADQDCCIGRGLSALNAKSGHDSFLFEVMLYFKCIFDRRNSSGTTFGSITKEDLHSLEFACPPIGLPLLDDFEEKTKPLHKTILNNHMQNQELTQLRDWLLPMLMNGQVTVG
jgi:type I restriction enzyme S subunit